MSASTAGQVPVDMQQVIQALSKQHGVEIEAIDNYSTEIVKLTLKSIEDSKKPKDVLYVFILDGIGNSKNLMESIKYSSILKKPEQLKKEMPPEGPSSWHAWQYDSTSNGVMRYVRLNPYREEQEGLFFYLSTTCNEEKRKQELDEFFRDGPSPDLPYCLVELFQRKPIEFPKGDDFPLNPGMFQYDPYPLFPETLDLSQWGQWQQEAGSSPTEGPVPTQEGPVPEVPEIWYGDPYGTLSSSCSHIPGHNDTVQLGVLPFSEGFSISDW